MASSYRFTVTGLVQGVHFRQSAKHRADRLGLRGWVQNRDDGSVDGVAQGEAGALDTFHRWLHRGPDAARVQAVQWTPSREPAHPGFTVKR